MAEVAITAPLLILLVSGMLDLGRAFYFDVMASDAARDGTLMLIGDPGQSPAYADVCKAVQQDMSNVGSVTCQSATSLPPYGSPPQPAAGQAIAVIYCGPQACGTTYPMPQRATVSVSIYYGFGLVTPGMNQLTPAGMITINRSSQMVSEW